LPGPELNQRCQTSATNVATSDVWRAISGHGGGRRQAQIYLVSRVLHVELIAHEDMRVQLTGMYLNVCYLNAFWRSLGFDLISYIWEWIRLVRLAPQAGRDSTCESPRADRDGLGYLILSRTLSEQQGMLLFIQSIPSVNGR
jgi:hypothetical protein